MSSHVHNCSDDLCIFDKLLTRLDAAEQALTDLGPGPYVPRHQYNNVCKQREEAFDRARVAEASESAWRADAKTLKGEREAALAREAVLRDALEKCSTYWEGTDVEAEMEAALSQSSEASEALLERVTEEARACPCGSQRQCPHCADVPAAWVARVQAKARAEALEEAAKIFDEPSDWLCLDQGGEETENIAARIRALSAVPVETPSAFDVWRKWFRDSGNADHWNKVECIECGLGRDCEVHPENNTEDDQ